MDETRRIVLLGKTGAGKSSLANTIFGQDVFEVNHTSNSGTNKCQAETRSVDGRRITLIDTPGLFDTDRPEEELKPEIVRCITKCAPGPHAFLIVLKVVKFTEHEKDVFMKIHEYFSEEAFKYAAVVFIRGDQLDEGMKIEDFVKQNKDLRDLVKKCGGRCHVIDNKYWKNKQQDEYRNNQFQVAELLNTIDNIVMENKGGYYTNEMLQTVERKTQDEKPIGLLPVKKSEQEIREQRKRPDSISRGFHSNVFFNSSGDASADTEALLPLIDLNPEPTEEEDLNSRRIVVLGKTGAGKSSTCNTIFGEPVFKINHTANPGTDTCVAETRSVNGRNVTLIDTPGLFDTDKSEDELKAEIAKSITECAPGPHAFLIVLQVEKFTEQEQQVIDEIQKTFSEEAFKYAVVVFTHGDQLPEGETIEDFVKQIKDLSDLMKKCGGRCHVIDNKYWKNSQQDEYRSNQFQVAELLNTIDKMVMENKGGYYTNGVLQTVLTKIKGHALLQSLFDARFIVLSTIITAAVGLVTGSVTGGVVGGCLANRDKQKNKKQE